MQVYLHLYYKMSEINLVIYLIIALFFIFLAVKGVFENRHKIKNNFCVICASISLTWLVLLSLYLVNLFDNILVISLLMGMSLTGIYYLAERKIGKINEKFKIFRLPFILTLIIIAYYVLTFENIFNNLLVIGSLWILFALIYFYNDSKLIKKLLECCKE